MIQFIICDLFVNVSKLMKTDNIKSKENKTKKSFDLIESSHIITIFLKVIPFGLELNIDCTTGLSFEIGSLL